MPFEFSNFLLAKLHASREEPDRKGSSCVTWRRNVTGVFYVAFRSAIYLKRDGCVSISWIQTLLEITLVHGMSAIAIRVYSISPNVWIASSR